MNTGSCATSGRQEPERIDVVLLVELHHLLLLALLVLLVLGLDRLHLRRQLLHPLHRAELFDRQREQTARTHTVSSTIDQPHGTPTLLWKNVRTDSKTSISGWKMLAATKHGSGGRSGRSGLEQPLILDRIEASVAQRLQRSRRHPARTSPRSMPYLDRLRRVFRARRVVLTALRRPSARAASGRRGSAAPTQRGHQRRSSAWPAASRWRSGSRSA